MPAICWATYHSPLGPLAVGAGADGLVSIRFVDRCAMRQSHSCYPLDRALQWLDIYFSGRCPGFTPPLAPVGTAFQQRVWSEVLAIPYGQTASYGEIARRIGCRSAQAVGGAVGCNPIALIIPCHRVLGARGNLTGYAYGLARKQKLLQLEHHE